MALAVVTATGLAVTVWPGHEAGPATAKSGTAPVSTVRVTRTDLSNSQTLSGTLGYGRTTLVKGSKDGLITWLPRAGSTVRRGSPLYQVNNSPVPLLYGSTPLYRPLSARGTTGPDVRVVADNLTALGYDTGPQPGPGTWIAQEPLPTPGTDTGTATATPSTSASESPAPEATASTPSPIRVEKGDAVLTETLIAAVKRWQTHIGMPPTGTLGIGDVTVLPGPVRVATVQAQPADQATGSLMTVTSIVKSVSALVSATNVGSMARGDTVTVVLPDNSTARGTITAIGTAAQIAEGDSDSSGTSGTVQLAVSVSVPDTAAVRRLTSAPVQVGFTPQTRKGVLAVPVDALLALSEGGYAVQLPGGRLVAVKTGMFTKGLVEISGTGITVGLRVVTTS